MQKIVNHPVAGFSLIELVIYVGIASLILGATVQLAWVGIYAGIKQEVTLTANQELRWVMKKISYEIRQSTAINSLTPASISLAQPNAAENPTVFTWSDNRVWMGQGNGGNCPIAAPCALTNSQMNVTNFVFTDLSNNGAKNVWINLEMIYQSSTAGQQFVANTSGQMAVELRSN